MAVIRPIQANQGLDTGAGSRPSTRIDDSVGQGLRQFGGAAQQAGNTLAQIELAQERAKMQAQEFRANQEFQRFGDDIAKEFADFEVNMDPSGEGFTEKVSSTFNEKAESFIKGVPEGLQPKFSELLKTSRESWINQASAKEADQRTSWYRKGVSDTQERLATQVVQNPNLYRAALDEGYRTIEASGLPETEKQALREGWAGVLQGAKAENYLRTQPEKLAGIDPGNSNAARLVRSMISVESSGNPGAESSKGASGLMQVMPDTAREIAREIGDGNFPANDDDAAVKAYLKNPDISVRYGTHYLRKMIDAYDGDIEAALIAYNGGPQRADRWLNSGRDDSVLPQETSDYYKKVARAYQKTDASQIPERNIAIKPAQGVNINNVNPVVLGRWQQVQNLFGKQIAIKSGFRDPKTNEKVGGAKGSQHIHGAALDLDVSGLSKPERLELIRIASAQGFTGIGVYNNSLHLDIGPRRSWGPSYGFESVPGWASEAIAEHMQGKASPLAAQMGGQQGSIYLNPEFSDMPLDKRIALYDKAIAEMNQRQKAQDTANSAAYNEYKGSIELGIQTGDVTSETQILSDETLKDGDKATLLKAYRTANKDRDQSAAIINAIMNGQEVAINPFDPDQSKAGNKAFEEMLKTAGQDRAYNIAQTYVAATGHVPDKLVSALRANLNSTDQSNVLVGMQEAAKLRDMAGPALAQAPNGDELNKAAIAFEHYTNDLGYTPDEAAQRYLDANDPAKRREREALLETKGVKDILKNVDETDVRDIWDTFGPNSITGYDVGTNDGAKAVIVSAYKELFETALVESNGDEDLARKLAGDRFKRVYGPSTMMLTNDTITKYPPETVYPPGPDGSHEYIRNQAFKALEEDGYAGVQDIALEVDPDGLTEADIQAGRPPKYILHFKRDGYWFRHNLPFYAMPEEATANDMSENRKRMESNRAQELDRQTAIQTGKPAQSVLDEMAAAGQAADQMTQAPVLSRDESVKALVDVKGYSQQDAASIVDAVNALDATQPGSEKEKSAYAAYIAVARPAIERYNYDPEWSPDILRRLERLKNEAANQGGGGGF